MKKLALYLIVIVLFCTAGLFLLNKPVIKIDNAINAPDTEREITIEVSSPAKLVESTVSGTIISGYSKDNQLVFAAGFPKTWNTYSASSSLGEIHLFVRTPKMDSAFITLPRTIEKLHSAYVVKENKKLFLFDAPDGGYYPLKNLSGREYIFDNKPVSVSQDLFKNLGYQYSYGASDSGKWVVRACKITAPDNCDEIATTPRSVVFVYGGNELNTVAVTNRGDVLFHNRQGWCRGEKTSDGVKCNKNVASFDTLYKTQLYSSINTQDGTLLGGYPAGRFWLLGDRTLKPTTLSPYSEAKHNNLELQSVSLFCGDLYAGFWPQGEVWKKNLGKTLWKKTTRFFSHPQNIKFNEIPYSEYLYSKKYGNYDNAGFFGQRATSMVNYKNSLFISSGNLGGWNKDIPNPSFLNTDQINEYGLIHTKTDSNCLTTVIDSNIAMKINIDSNNISVYNNAAKVAETKLHDFDINQIDHFYIGEGVFGTLSDKEISVQVIKN